MGLDDGMQAVERYWRAIAHHDWDDLAASVAEDVTIAWPATGELIAGRDNVVAVNREYPDGWSIDVRSIVGAGEHIASEVYVPFDGVGTFAVGSFWTVRDGVIASGTEYWVTVSGEVPPEWRGPFVRRLDESAMTAWRG